MEFLFDVFLIYLAAVNIIAAAVVIYDKSISKLPRGSIRRIPEKTFILFSAIGGGVGTLLSMFWIRHKTKSHDGLLLAIGLFTAAWVAAILLLI
ncbi:MAG: DUF1294 domain-containing protein [Ruminococcaceae bacterium]|nr:DUF1294 domain-containing protein [Oscillospiraceae bacterium]